MKVCPGVKYKEFLGFSKTGYFLWKSNTYCGNIALCVKIENSAGKTA